MAPSCFPCTGGSVAKPRARLELSDAELLAPVEDLHRPGHRPGSSRSAEPLRIGWHKDSTVILAKTPNAFLSSGALQVGGRVSSRAFKLSGSVQDHSKWLPVASPVCRGASLMRSGKGSTKRLGTALT